MYKKASRPNKPLIEKRRRDRINASLVQLKEMVLVARQHELLITANKLEKADILELTVCYIKDMMNKKEKDAWMNSSTPSSSLYKIGYETCIAEISRHFENTIDMSAQQKGEIMEYIRTKATSKLPVPSQMFSKSDFECPISAGLNEQTELPAAQVSTHSCLKTDYLGNTSDSSRGLKDTAANMKLKGLSALETVHTECENPGHLEQPTYANVSTENSLTLNARNMLNQVQYPGCLSGSIPNAFNTVGDKFATNDTVFHPMLPVHNTTQVNSISQTVQQSTGNGDTTKQVVWRPW